MQIKACHTVIKCIKKSYLFLSLIILTIPLSFAKQEHKPEKIYCAGPLFNDDERVEMQNIAKYLEDYGYSTFLPQRDGIEGYKMLSPLVKLGYTEEYAQQLLETAIFALDTYQILINCQAVVANLRNRQQQLPDDGTVSESAIAWSYNKPLIFYKSNENKLDSSNNALVYGLTNFSVNHRLNDIPQLLENKLLHAKPIDISTLPEIIWKGERLWKIMQELPKDEGRRLNALAKSISSVFS